MVWRTKLQKNNPPKFLGTDSFKDDVRRVRRRLRRVAKPRLVFIDETGMKTNVRPSQTLVLKGDQGDIKVDKPGSYSDRVDFIGAITATELFPPLVLTPKDRKAHGSKGVTQAIFGDFVAHELAPALNASDEQSFTLVLDASRAHNVAGIEQALDNAGCDKVDHIMILPKETAKKVSPLDNALWKDLKKKVRDAGKNRKVDAAWLARQLRQSWSSLDPGLLPAHYHHCRLYAGDALDDDL
jgi:hypothetical protein